MKRGGFSTRSAQSPLRLGYLLIAQMCHPLHMPRVHFNESIPPTASKRISNEILLTIENELKNVSKNSFAFSITRYVLLTSWLVTK
jgi:hypothetical protein